MSSRVQSRRPTSRRRLSEGSTSRRKMVRDLDLNRHPDGASYASSSADHLSVPQYQPLLPQAGAEQPSSIASQAIVIPDEDDDVVLLSSTTVSSQARGAPIVPIILLDEDSDVPQGHSDSGVIVQEPITRLTLYNHRSAERNPRKRTIINCEEYECREYFSCTKVVEMVQLQEMEQPPPPPPPKELVFNCSVCLGELDEATSTICGHIFCQKCIKASIQAQKKCPTCRKHLTMKNIHRVYLPTTK